MKDEFNFEGEIQEANWAMLELHHKREALYLVENSLNLSFAGEIIAQDNVEIVKKWLSTGELRKPKEKEIQTWQAEPALKMFKFLIVSPYVLIQLKEAVNN